ncbi:MAG: acetoacetate--CoA ligase, partial [Candidatus Neomarinimicrobiota bacterium]
LPFDHPLYIMYSSGTTGLPKSIVHSAGGTLVQHLKEHRLHCDLRRGDTILYFTTCGWMMWNWLVSSLAVGATVVLYDGSPVYPDAGALWRMAEQLGITVFGTSARYLAALEAAGEQPGKQHDLRRLRSILSTGSTLSEESFDYVYREVKADLLLGSITGGTDIVSCFALANPTLPVKRGQLQCRGLGMKVEAYDPTGQPVVGAQGELVCTRAFPSMPIYFWDDPDNAKYRQAYFEDYPGVWRHGDYISIYPDGGVKVFGRSDATLNPGGVRIGTAEIYRVVESLPEVDDALAVGQQQDGEDRVILFVKLSGNGQLGPELEATIRESLRTRCSPRHVPDLIMAVPDIPYTINGKKVELAVKQLLTGQEAPNRDALANPEALDHFRELGLET